MIYLYIISNIYFWLTIRKCKISSNNVFVFVFWGFLLLYPLTRCIPNPLDVYSNSMEYTLIQDQFLLTASLALITFAVCLKKYPVTEETNSYIHIPNLKTIYFLYILIFPIALYINFNSNWSTGEGAGLASLAAYTRHAITILSIFIFMGKNTKYSIKIMVLILFLIITFLSTQRTNALLLIMAFVYNMKPNKKVLLSLFMGIILLLMLGSIRSGESYLNLLYPIYGEGTLGSEGLAQAIDYSSSHKYSYSQLFLIFNGCINWIMNTLHINTSLLTYEDIITKSGRIYYPMGGFYYLSDAYLMHPYIGPIFYTCLIYWFYRKSINKYYRSHDPWSLIRISMLFIAIKGSLATFLAVLVFNYLLYNCIWQLLKKRKSRITNENNKYKSIRLLFK